MLNGARISVLVGQVKAAGVPQHMPMDRKGQGGGFARSADHVVDRTPRERRSALREEHVRPPRSAGLSRRNARNSGPCRGCTDDTPCLSRRTSSNAACTLMCSQRKRLTSATRNPCRPTLRAAPMRHSTSAGVSIPGHADPYSSDPVTGPYWEPGTRWGQDLFAQNPTIACASLGPIEVMATLARKRKARDIDLLSF
jgi:hypothetical protein